MNTTDAANFLSQAIDRFTDRAVVYLPNLVSAFIVLLLGWIVALALRKILRGLARAAVAWLSRHHLLERGMKKTTLSGSVPSLVAGIGYWGVLIFFVAEAIEQLGLPGLSNWLQDLAAYLPALLLGVLIVIGGVVLGHLVSERISSGIGAEYGGLAKVVQGAVVLMAIVVASDQIGIHSTFLMVTLGILLAAIVGGVAAAFAFGAGPAVSNVIASHHLRKRYRTGDHIRIDGTEGVIREIAPVSITLETGEGPVTIPAKAFLEGKSLLIKDSSDV